MSYANILPNLLKVFKHISVATETAFFSPLEFILDFLFTWEHLEVPPTNHKSTLGFEYAAFLSWNTPFLHTYISL